MKMMVQTSQFFFSLHACSCKLVPSPVPGDHHPHLPHDLAVADLTLLCVHGPSLCRKTAGCGLRDPFHESCVSRLGRTVKKTRQNAINKNSKLWGAEKHTSSSASLLRFPRMSSAGAAER